MGRAFPTGDARHTPDSIDRGLARRTKCRPIDQIGLSRAVDFAAQGPPMNGMAGDSNGMMRSRSSIIWSTFLTIHIIRAHTELSEVKKRQVAVKKAPSLRALRISR
jgi:hypothetical protein